MDKMYMQYKKLQPWGIGGSRRRQVFPLPLRTGALPALLNVQIFGGFSSRGTPHAGLHTERNRTLIAFTSQTQ